MNNNPPLSPTSGPRHGRRPSQTMPFRRLSFTAPISPVLASPGVFNTPIPSPTITFISHSSAPSLPPSRSASPTRARSIPLRFSSRRGSFSEGSKSAGGLLGLVSLILLAVVFLFTLLGTWESTSLMAGKRVREMRYWFPQFRLGDNGWDTAAIDDEVDVNIEDGYDRQDEVGAWDSPNASSTFTSTAIDSASTVSLPTCQRTLLFRFANLHGFGSEFSLLLRVAVLARHYSYTLLIDSSQWNYGPFESYFRPLTLSCIPPSIPNTKIDGRLGGGLRRARLHTTESELEDKVVRPGWVNEDHVEWKRDVDSLDRLFMNLFTDEAAIENLHKADLLTSENAKSEDEEIEVVPRALWEAIRVQSAAVQDLWRPNQMVMREVARLKKRIGLHPQGVVVGMHVRLGDKYLEADRIGPQPTSSSHHKSSSHRDAGPGLHSTTLSHYFSSAKSLLLASPAAKHTLPTKPTLLIMSDDPDAWKAFADDPRGKGWHVVGTGVADSEASNNLRRRQLVDIHEMEERASVGEKRDLVEDFLVKSTGSAGKKGHPLRKTGGFHETMFNKLPLSTRISLTKTFVRDVTLLATSSQSDGLVLSGSSNVGRLMTVLMGVERMDDVRSVDTRWFPTARFI